ncbi:hypothetical protein MASR2M39_25220 [Ignavibacteriales bacterium]
MGAKFIKGFLFIVLCLTIQINSQKFDWAKCLNGNYVYANGIAKDKHGNTYVVGSFADQLNVDGHTLNTSGNYDIFIAKFDNSGNVVWLKKAGGNMEDAAKDVSIDDSGNIFITGYFSAAAIFDTTHISSEGASNMFVAKYTNIGNCIWVKRSISSGLVKGEKIKVMFDQKILITGTYTNPVLFGSFQLFPNNTVTGFTDSFMASMDASGTFLWAECVVGYYWESANGVSYDLLGNMYFTGTTWQVNDDSNIRLFGSEDVFTNIYVKKYGPTGNLIFSKILGGLSDDNVAGVVADSKGNIFLAGTNSNSANFDTIQVAKAGAFLAKFNPLGHIQWIQTIPGTRMRAKALNADEKNNLYVTGEYQDTLMLGDSVFINQSYTDLFYVMYDSSAKVKWADVAGGPMADQSYGITAGPKVGIIGLATYPFRFRDSTLECGSSFVAVVNNNHIKLLSPNGGEYLKAGTQNTILWESHVLDSLEIQYTTDNGGSWISITENASGGSFLWTVPQLSSAICKIRLVYHDALIPTQVESDSTFTIYTEGNFSLRFDGIDDYVGNMIEDKVPSNGPFTVEAWIKLENPNFMALINRGPAWSYNLYHNDAFYWGIRDFEPPTYVNYSVPEINIWHHIAGTKSNDGTINLFNDGVKVASKNYVTGTIPSSTLDLQFGRYLGGGYFLNCWMTKIRISNISRYSSNFIPSTSYSLDTNVVGQWDFNTGVGNALFDISPNQINGTIYGGATWSTDFPTVATSSILLTSPNGGENWAVGSTHNITWTQTGLTNVKLEYTSNNGTSWNQIIASTSATPGSYSWTIPNSVSTNCKVRVTDVANTSINDLSDTVFAISTAPIIIVTSPNGGENWAVGSSHNVTWSQTGVANVELEYSGNGGANWYQITASTSASTGSYSWTIPNTVSSNCKVRITDVNNNSITDQSDNLFSISQQSTGNYSLYFDGINDEVGNMIEDKLRGNATFTLELWVKNQSPNVAPLITRGADSGVDWSYNLYLHDRLYFGVNTPLGYVSNTPPSSNEWHHIAAVKSADGFLRIFIDGIKVNELSYGVGSLVSSHSLQFGKYFANASSDYFKGFLTKIRISKIARYQNNFTPIINYTLDTNTVGQWDFTEGSGTVLSDASTNHINGTIYGATWSTDFPQVPAAISLTSPNGGENWTVGSTHNITWSQTGVINVKLEYTSNNGTIWNQIVSSTSAATGSYSWTIPTTVSTNCKVKITDVNNSAVTDQSNAVFTISAAPTLALTSPNGGENWLVGSSHSITWNQTGVANVKLEYTSNNGTSWNQIVGSTSASTGSYSWTIPNSVSNNCKVRVTSTTNSLISDESNSQFTISVIPVPVVELTSPNGGENWFSGSQYSITWNFVNVQKLKLEYSSNNGSDWNLIDSSVTANPGSYIWTVPNTPSTSCKVRITAVENGPVSDQSDGVFSISEPPSVRLISPVGGEKWLSGKQYSIIWSFVNIENVKLEYSTNNGLDWTTIEASFAANSGSYIWTVPAIESIQCLVRISALNNPSFSDQSDAPFTIEPERTLSLTSPIGGEVFTSGDRMEIKWNSLNLETIDLYYSTDNGNDWHLIADSVSASLQSFYWDIPEINSNLVKIRTVYTRKSEIKSESAGTITILPSPKVVLQSNISGAYLKSGTTYLLEWFVENVSSVNISFSSDEGATWNELAVGISSSVRSYNWMVPQLNSKNCRIKIASSTNQSLSSVNPGNFTVYTYAASVSLSNTWQFGDIKDINNYRLVSIPGNTSENLGNIIPGKHINEWNAYWDNGEDNNYQVQYDGSDKFKFEPGKGFWVLSKNQVSLSKQTDAVTIDSTLIFRIPLHKGWNIIGNTFSKSVNWSEIRAVNSLPQNSLIYWWEGKWTFPSMMEPYKGYYYFNVDNRSQLKLIYPVEQSLTKINHENFVTVPEDRVKISFAGNEITASFNGTASTGLDTIDYLLPNISFGGKSISFVQNSAEGIARQLFIESQPKDSTGNSFRFRVVNNSSSSDLLEIAPSKNIQAENVWLLDEKYSEFIDITKKDKFSIVPQDDPRYYTLLVGSEEYINSIRSKFLPVEYILYQNYPNPFNPETSIKYALPQNSYVKIKLFDILGNEVITLFEGDESAGVHTRTFDLSGFASGVYLYRLETRNKNFVKKMVLLK